ncbi:very-long-chain (3R)-3-hydroxyacyl-CoA dehydratase 1-like [Stegodyphus dumicola]|uniref:very-long-chain (3R)-3-hydroxyacyl-CoA dehydratase 1-like n=1 Tax=Stegodyphus dumicola TaxID=202533 RepID=UPI0015AACCAE|nr:very-long-chain (3R)-3-hydroxyacyl-CoA dehydratase 1-like [Stegodyphus dumicola]
MNDSKLENEKSKKDMVAFSKPYLVLYNSVQTAGWSYILFQTLKFLIENRSISGLWGVIGSSLLTFQTLAVLEVVHCILGLVKASALVTSIQVASRVIQAWGIMNPIENVHNSPTLALAIIAWSISEITRYSFYCCNLLGLPSKTLTWCRYSFFVALYPAGVFSEVSNIFLALDTIKRKQLFSLTLPNPMNISFSFYYANILILLSYIPCSSIFKSA